jgi:aminoglycoside 6'-N-acetyltransferase I
VTIRDIEERDIRAVAEMCAALWPDSSVEEHEEEVMTLVRGTAQPVYPSQVLVAEEGAELVGFAHVGMRSYADGCDAARPAGYLEGWYVRDGWRKRGVGRALVEAAKRWARAQGCVEMGSDTWLDNEGSQRAHEALGFGEVDRCVVYRMRL